MKDFAIVIGVIMLGVIAYMLYKSSPTILSKTEPATPPAEPTEPTDVVEKTIDDYVQDVNQMVTPYQLPPYTCIVYDEFGRQLRVTSPTNSLWFQQLCNGQISYPYNNYYFYSPNWWYRRRRHHRFPRNPHRLPAGGHRGGRRFGGGRTR